MRVWEHVSSVVQIVYRLGQKAEKMANRHSQTASTFFDYSDLFADMKKRSVAEEYEPDSDDATSRQRLLMILRDLQKASSEAAEAYANMTRGLDTCIVMIEDSMPKARSQA
jgi:hypothetical protein